MEDWIWIKNRTHGNDGSGGHMLFDSSRGIKSQTGSDSKFLVAQGTANNQTNANGLQAVSSDGFTPGSMTRTNETGDNYVAWQWKANGGTTTSVSASGTGNGCVNACTHQANTTSGFSIITYTGRDDQLSNGQHSLLAHGLGAAPDFTIMKRTDDSGDWFVMGSFQGANSYPYSNNQWLKLNGTETINGNYYTGDTAPNATNIYLGNYGVNIASATYVCYAFTEIKGFSSFGKYKGNGNSNGPFVYTGFKPALVITKAVATASWSLYDNKRTGFNPIDVWLRANGSDAESTSAISGEDIDLLSNGFKLRNSDNTVNGNGTTYIYMAFAESPFVTSTGIPTTAR